MWLFVHRPFEIWPILGDIRLERLYMIFTLVAWFAISPKIWTSNSNNAAIFFVAFSIFISTLMSPYHGLGNNLTTENWFKVFVFFLLVMTSVQTEKDLKILVTAFSVVFSIYMLHSFREYLNGKMVYRMGIARMVGVDSTMNDPNTFGASINYALPLLLPLMSLGKGINNKRQKKMIFLLLVSSFVLSVLCVQLTGSRSSFAILAASLLGLTMLSKYRIRILLLLAVLACVVWVSTPERLKIRYISLIDSSVLEGQDMKGAQASADSRNEFFWIGLEIWKKYPLFGTGPEGFYYASGLDIQSHGLIPQVLSELGTLGAIAYLSFIGAVFANHINAGRLYKRMQALKRENEVIYLYRVSFAVAWTVVLLIALGFSGHNAFRFTWVWYAAFQAFAISLMSKKVTEAIDHSSLIASQRQNMPYTTRERQQPHLGVQG